MIINLRLKRQRDTMNLIFLIRNKSKEAEVQKHIIRLVNMDLNIILKSK